MGGHDRTHLVNDNRNADPDAPKQVRLEEFANRLDKAMLARGWRQSDLARAAGLNREAISSYVRGRNWPTDVSLQKLAKALGVAPEELLPNKTIAAIREDTPSFQVKTSVNEPGKAWVVLNRLMDLTDAMRIGAIVSEAAERERGR